LGWCVSEAPCFPANSRVVGAWFREEERAKATAVYTVGEYLGLACFGPALFWIANRFGWRTLFFLVGAAGIVFGGLWWILYREPEPAGPAARWTGNPVSWPQVRRLLRSRQVWGASLGQFGGNSTLVFFLTWFPTYLAKDR
jgi:MFS transporter, ACS family, D-galactonate transporter